MGSTTGRLGSLLPVVVEGNQLSRLFVGQQLFPDPEEVFAELSQPFNEALLQFFLHRGREREREKEKEGGGEGKKKKKEQ